MTSKPPVRAETTAAPLMCDPVPPIHGETWRAPRAMSSRPAAGRPPRTARRRKRAAGRAAAPLAALLLALTPPASAGERWSLSGGVSVVGQAASDSRAASEITGSADLHIELATRRGSVEAYVEAGAIPRTDGVFTFVPESNADAGTVVAGSGELRAQVSELKYRHELRDDRSLVAGLLDPTVYLDTTRVGNDENMQFLGTAFLNNPTIDFPDYTLGVAFGQPAAGRRPSLVAVIAASDGLGDERNGSYHRLFDLAADGKGEFFGVELDWSSPERLLRVGAWHNSADRRPLSGTTTLSHGQGAYMALGLAHERHEAGVRLGAAEDTASGASGFASLTYQLDKGALVFGVGAARTWLASELSQPGRDDVDHTEAYVRYELRPELYVTPSIQVVRNSGFDSSGVDRSDRVVVYGVRLRYRFGIAD